MGPKHSAPLIGGPRSNGAERPGSALGRLARSSPADAEWPWPELARLLERARDAALPLLERVWLQTEFSALVDELFMIRVAALKRQLGGRVAATRSDALAQLAAIAARTHDAVDAQQVLWRDELMPAFVAKGLRLVSPGRFSVSQRNAASSHFAASVFPVLTPLTVDPGHPLPRLPGRSLNVAFTLMPAEGRRPHGGAQLAVVHVPASLRRFIPLPCDSWGTYALLEEVVAAGAGELFTGHDVGEAAVFRVTRGHDPRAGDDTSGAAPAVGAGRTHREAPVVRLELSADAPPLLESLLVAALKLEARDVYRVSAPLRIADLLPLASLTRAPARLLDLTSSRSRRQVG